MNRIPLILILTVSVGFSASAYAQESLIPVWVKGVAGWWADGNTTDEEFLEAIEFLINENYIKINSVRLINDNPTITPTSTDCLIETFLDVSEYGGTIEPIIDVQCDNEFMYVKSNGIPHYGFVQITPNALSEQNHNWKISMNPNVAAQTSQIPLIGPVGFAVNGIPIYGPNEGAYPDPFGDPVYNGILDSCLGHTAQRGVYHYHAFELSCFALNIGNYKEFSILGYALDGFPIYGPYGYIDGDESEIVEFQSSWVKTGDPTTYAWDNHEYQQNSDESYLDECNGRDDSILGYHYRATENFPYLLGCYTGTSTSNQFTTTQQRDLPPGEIPEGCPQPGDSHPSTPPPDYCPKPPQR